MIMRKGYKGEGSIFRRPEKHVWGITESLQCTQFHSYYTWRSLHKIWRKLIHLSKYGCKDLVVERKQFYALVQDIEKENQLLRENNSLNFSCNVRDSYTVWISCWDEPFQWTCLRHSGPQIRVRNWELFFLFLILNICCGCSKEPSHMRRSKEPSRMRRFFWAPKTHV